MKLYLQTVYFDKEKRLYVAEYSNGINWMTRLFDKDSKIPTITE